MTKKVKASRVQYWKDCRQNSINEGKQVYILHREENWNKIKTFGFLIILRTNNTNKIHKRMSFRKYHIRDMFSWLVLSVVPPSRVKFKPLFSIVWYFCCNLLSLLRHVVSYVHFHAVIYLLIQTSKQHWLPKQKSFNMTKMDNKLLHDRDFSLYSLVTNIYTYVLVLVHTEHSLYIPMYFCLDAMQI